jgi:rod shape-determining protein MreD
MAEFSASRLWTMRATYLGLCLAIIIWHLLPLETLPRRWAPPDLLVGFTFAWALRRPDYVPILSIALVMLTADLLFQRPPGLMAALVLIAAEYLRNRFGGLSKASFAGEWLSVSIMIVAIAIANRLVLVILAVDVAPLGLTAIQAAMTILAYPAIAGITRALLGKRRLFTTRPEPKASRV